jgi:hypothetical protein
MLPARIRYADTRPKNKLAVRDTRRLLTLDRLRPTENRSSSTEFSP